jgi:hypothetical protein
MQVTLDRDAYWRPSRTSPQWVGGWSNWPVKMLASTTMSAFRSSSGQEAEGFSVDGGTNPYVTNEAQLAFAMPAGSSAAGKGEPLSAAVAAALGVPAGGTISPGVLGAAPPPPTTTTTTLPPTVGVDDVSVEEGDVGARDATFTVALSKPGNAPVTVEARAVASSATAAEDYLATSTTLTFAPGETVKTVGVPVVGDYDDEPDESFMLELTSVTNATLSDPVAKGTILDDDDPPTVSIGDVSIWEGNAGAARTAQFAVTLSDAPKVPVTVDVTVLEGSARFGEDLHPVPAQTLTFQPGATVLIVSVPVLPDRAQEGDETFTVRLADPTGGFVLGDPDAVGAVHDDD